MPRRKAGELIAIEIDILLEALDTGGEGEHEFYGFAMAKRLQDGQRSYGLIAHGTLYKALARLENAGMLESHLEDPDIAADEGRPRRRLYRITGPGRVAAAAALDKRQRVSSQFPPGLEPA
ncbi:MAG TPA: helix-turn-helix transcriptional regulator [Ilumatobacter sp.]|nr:helix-turn-helix transcriptional regulator [Ilumatobacter sp.]